MSPSIAELLPAISALSQADKFQLVQLVVAQLAQENSVETQERPAPSAPRQFIGGRHKPKQVINDYLPNTSEGWL